MKVSPDHGALVLDSLQLEETTGSKYWIYLLFKAEIRIKKILWWGPDFGLGFGKLISSQYHACSHIFVLKNTVDVAKENEEISD